MHGTQSISIERFLEMTSAEAQPQQPGQTQQQPSQVQQQVPQQQAQQQQQQHQQQQQIQPPQTQQQQILTNLNRSSQQTTQLGSSAATPIVITASPAQQSSQVPVITNLAPNAIITQPSSVLILVSLTESF